MKSRLRLALAAAAAAAAAYVAFVQLGGPQVEAARVVRRDIVQSVVASGRVARPHRVEIGSQIVGTVARVPVAEGQAVKAGQALVELEVAESLAAVRQAETAVAQAEARLRQLAELQRPVAAQALRQAEANLANARAQYERTRRLHDAGYVGQAALDEARRGLEVAQTHADAGRKQLEATEPAGAEAALAASALEQARATLQAARARHRYTTLRAPVDGTLIARNVERGDVAQPGKVLMVLSPAGNTELVLQLDERNLARVALGQQALASADAYPAERFAAEVVYVNPAVDAQRGTVEVKLRVREPPSYLRDDMTVSVDVEIARRAAALTLAAEAVRDANGRSPWVFAVRDGRAVKQPLRLGLRGEGAVEVLDGLAEGELAVASAANGAAPGQRVRARVRGE